VAAGCCAGVGSRHGPARDRVQPAAWPPPLCVGGVAGLGGGGAGAGGPRRGTDSSQRLGRHRYVVERSLAWLVSYRRLQVRDERRADILLGFVHLACALICLTSLDGPKGAPRSA